MEQNGFTVPEQHGYNTNYQNSTHKIQTETNKPYTMELNPFYQKQPKMNIQNTPQQGHSVSTVKKSECNKIYGANPLLPEAAQNQ